MRLACSRHGAVEERGRGPAPAPVAMVRALVVVEAQELLQGLIQLGAAREVAPPEAHPPVLLEERPLEPFDKAIGPGMAGLGAGVCRMPRASQVAAKAPWNSFPRSVRTRWTGQPARWKRGASSCRRKRAVAAGDSSGRIRATP